jgi:hypothetical protein
MTVKRGTKQPIKRGQAAKGTRTRRTTALAVSPADDCRQKVLGCIRQQSGGRDLSGNPKLGDIGVDGFILAGCINEKLGTNYTGTDFPPTMRVLDVIHKVCG